jgi:transposase
MLGPPKPRRLDAPVAVSLEDLVPRDDFYRHLEARLDPGFVREWARERYAERGRPSVDPVVFFKLQLVMFFEGLRSERQLLRVVADRLSLRWYLEYDLAEPLPDHSSLTRIRERYEVAVVRRCVAVIVARCSAAGLVGGGERSVDVTKVAANVARASLINRHGRGTTGDAAGSGRAPGPRSRSAGWAGPTRWVPCRRAEPEGPGGSLGGQRASARPWADPTTTATRRPGRATSKRGGRFATQ